MKKFFLILLCSFCVAMATNAQSVSVNTDGSTADASSILDVKSTTKGMLVPRMTTVQRTGIVSPANGLLVYDTNVKSFWYYNGTVWTNLEGSSGITFPYSKIGVVPNLPLLELTNTGSNGSAIKGTSYSNHGILGVTNSDNAHAGIRGDATGNGSAGVRGSSNNATGVGVDAVHTAGGLALNVNGNLRIAGGNTLPGAGKILTSDAEGNATWKSNRVAFSATGGGAIASFASTYLLANTERYDYSNSFNTTTGSFTAPVTGVYSLGAQIFYSLTNDANDNIETGEINIHIIRGASTIIISSPFATISNGSNSSNATALAISDIRLLAGDIVKINGVQINSADATVGWSADFFGHLIFAE